MRVLVVAPQPFFSPRGTPFSVYYRTLLTSELGHEADLLTYGQGDDVDIPRVRIIRIPAFRFLGKVKTGPSGLKLFLDLFMVLWTVGLLLRRRYDVIHAHEESVFWCRWLKPLFRVRLIYDMHSSLPQQLHNFSYTRLRFVHWIFERLENSALHAADAVITICPSLEIYARGIAADPDKVLLIENSIFDPIRFRHALEGTESPQAAELPAPVVDEALKAWQERHLPERTIVYAGTLEAYQGIDTLIAAFAHVVQTVPDAGLLIIGGQSEQVANYRKLASEVGLEHHVYFTGQVSQTLAQELVARAGACISPRCSGNNTPLKIYHLMASGVPLIATRIESHTQVLDDEIATLTNASIEGLAAGMLTVLEDRDQANAKAREGQERYRSCYSRAVYAEKMQFLFSKVA